MTLRKLPILNQLFDAQDRKISYLRVSVTDRCNYACSYCVPKAGVVPVQRAQLLNFEEIARLVTLMAGMGVRRVRLTGGEPTTRKGIVGLVKTLVGIVGIDEVVMTTNAHILDAMAAPLANAGLSGVNVSLDTLEPGPFAQLTVRGNIDRVIRGIDAALAAGLRVSTNAVALRGVNDRQLVSLCEFAWARGIRPRFIEHMPMSDGDVFSSHAQLSAAAIRNTIAAELDAPLHLVAAVKNRGPAEYWQVGASERQFGIISAMSEHFCSTCNRVRLSSTGQLHTCLASDDTTDLRDLARAGADDSDLRSAIVHALSRKREGHEFQFSGAGGPKKHMISIGG